MSLKLVRNPIIFALDVDTKDQVKKYLDLVGSDVGAIKLGPRLVYRYGAELIEYCAQIAPVFVDNKYFDIPSTMLAAVKASFDAGASLVTVHALAGREALTQLATLEKELNAVRPFKVLAVTILTSWNESSMPNSFQTWPVSQHVLSLVQLVQSSGLSGVVCSPHELSLLHELSLFKVTPGIRLDSEVALNDGKATNAANDDQKRVMNPRQAISAGASALVIGRPILNALDPKEKVREILSVCV